MNILEKLWEKYGKRNIKLKHFNEPIVRQNGKKGGGKTIAVIFDGDERHVGYTECSKKDNYSKKRGREIALIRASRRAIGILKQPFDYKEGEGQPKWEQYSFSFNINEPYLMLPIEVPEFLYIVKEKEVEK